MKMVLPVFINVRCAILIVFFIPLFTKAQLNPLKKFELIAGISAGKPLGIDKDIFFQSGIKVNAGIRRNLRLPSNTYLVIGFMAADQLYYIEGYFIKTNEGDAFIRTSDNVKVNALDFSPLSLDIGIKKFLKRIVAGGGLQTSYMDRVHRTFKVGSTEMKENFRLDRKFSLLLNGSIGFTPALMKSLRLELISSYSLTSLTRHANFNPFSIGLQLSVGLLK
jgi:hypothetical protein